MPNDHSDTTSPSSACPSPSSASSSSSSCSASASNSGMPSSLPHSSQPLQETFTDRGSVPAAVPDAAAALEGPAAAAPSAAATASKEHGGRPHRQGGAACAMSSASASAAAAMRDATRPPAAASAPRCVPPIAASVGHPEKCAAAASGPQDCVVELREAAGCVATDAAITAAAEASLGAAAAAAADNAEQTAHASEILRGTYRLQNLKSHRRRLLHAGAAATAVDILLLAANALLRSLRGVDDSWLASLSDSAAAVGKFLLPLLRAVIMIYCMLSFKRFSLFPLFGRLVGTAGGRSRAGAPGASLFSSSPPGISARAAAPCLCTGGTAAAASLQRGSAAVACESHAVPIVFTEQAPACAAAAAAAPVGTLTAAAKRTEQPKGGNYAAGRLSLGGHSCRSCTAGTYSKLMQDGRQQQPLLSYDIEAAAAPEVAAGIPVAGAAAGGLPSPASDPAAAAEACRATAAGADASSLALAEAATVMTAAREIKETAATRAHISEQRNSLAFRLLLLCFIGGTLRAINFELPKATSFQERGRSLLLLPSLLGGWPSWLQQQQQQLHVQQQTQSQPHQQKVSWLPEDPPQSIISRSSSSRRRANPSPAPLGSYPPPAYLRNAAAAADETPSVTAAAPAVTIASFPAAASSAAPPASGTSGAEVSAAADGAFIGGDAPAFGGERGLLAASGASGFVDGTAAAGGAADAEEAAAGAGFDAASGTPDVWRFVVLFLLLEAAWGVAAPFVEAMLLWRLQRCAAEERSVLHACVLHATSRYELLLRQQEEQQQGQVWGLPGAVPWMPKGHMVGVSGGPAAADTVDAAGSPHGEMAVTEKQPCAAGASEEASSTPGAAGPAAATAAAAASGPPPTADVVLEEEEEEVANADVDWFELLKLLRPYFWPSGREEVGAAESAAEAAAGDEAESAANIWRSPVVLRLLAVSTFFTIACSKALTLVSPLLIGAAADIAAKAAAAAAAQRHDAAAAYGRQAAQWVVAFAVASWGADFFKEAQALAYVKVQQAASVEISARTLRHVLALHLEWHTKKQMGHVVRVIDRGTEGCASLMTYCILYLGPVVFECIAVCLVFLFHMKHQVLASLLFLSVSIYAWVTLQVTFWRRKWREKQNRSDSTFHQLVVDALTNFETVKIFNAEDFEVRRYMMAVEEYQSVGTKIQGSLSFLNLSQRTVVCATLVAGLIFVSQAMTDGRMGVSQFVTAHMYFLNVFAPLNFLGTIYHVIVRSAIDARALCRLLRTKPEITDAPDAISLTQVLSVNSSAAAAAHGSAVDAGGQRPQEEGVVEPQVSAAEAAGVPPGADADEGCGHNSRSSSSGSSSSSRWRKKKTPEGTSFSVGASQHLLAEEKAAAGGGATAGAAASVGRGQWLERRAVVPPAVLGEHAGRAMRAPRIDFVNVCFSYAGRRHLKGSLRNISLTVKPGTTCGLVGPSGSGKSTMMKLLLRLLEPRRGRVLIDGVDIAMVTQESLRRCMGMVPQDAVMFNASIYANILYANRQASFKDVEAAAEAAQLMPLIHSMKDGWDTRVGERGLKLSGGERQRVAIARCLLRNPPVVLLDEATSSLDSLSEAAIQKALLRLSSSRTVLMIAHRLSTVMHADLICVMKDGGIVEQGTHAQLLAANGAYAELWKAQARGENLLL